MGKLIGIVLGIYILVVAVNFVGDIVSPTVLVAEPNRITINHGGQGSLKLGVNNNHSELRNLRVQAPSFLKYSIVLVDVKRIVTGTPYSNALDVTFTANSDAPTGSYKIEFCHPRDVLRLTYPWASDLRTEAMIIVAP